ncbi:MAG: TolC family protein, partial [Oligoflexia bacterium]|nr:TolC family protein [Oligoflexia bacterium]
GQYWKTYLAHIAYQQAQEGLKTYKKLVHQINNKKKYNFLNPGERPQILAEYQSIQQSTDQQKQNYEKEKKALFLLLKKSPGEYDIVFKEEKISPPPSFSKLKIENIRAVKIKDSQISQQKLKLKTKQSLLFPSFQLSGKGGLIPAGSSSDLEFSSKQSFYEFGASLSWPLFSKSFYEKVNQEKYQLEENKIDFEITKQELKNQLSQLEKEIAVSYKNIERANKATRYQKQAFRELQKSFEQGRVDIFELINVENKLRESEIKKKRALSEYSLLILQMLALRDQLVDDYLVSSKKN